MTLWRGRHRRVRRFARDDILVCVAFNLVRRRRQRRWTQAKLARQLRLLVSVIRALEIAQLSFTLAAFEEIVDLVGPSASDLLSPIPARLRTVAMRPSSGEAGMTDIRLDGNTRRAHFFVAPSE